MSDLVISLHRIEPVSRRGDPGRGLAATVHDPLWLLARQSEFGELTGEDTGSPIHVELSLQHHRLDGWRPEGAAEPLPYAPDEQVLEAVVAGESAGPQLSFRDRLDAGRRLRATVGDALNGKARATFPLPEPPTTGSMRRAASVFADGLAVAGAVRAARGAGDAALADALGATNAEVSAARPALEEFAAWCETTFGLGPVTWAPERLERRFELDAAGVAVLRAPAHTRDVVDAPDLDLLEGAAGLPDDAAAERATRRIPTTIRFPGMPNDRFWQFEDAQLALYRIDAATHDLARLALVEFSSIYGNDWFTFPVPLQYGSVSWVPEMVVRDTFGRSELVSAAADATWSMFVPSRPAEVPPRLVVPAVTVSALQGQVVEAVAFLRDEHANLVWAIEQTVTDAEGRTIDVVAEYASAQSPPPLLPTDAELLYRLMTDVPEHWVPFVPVQVDDSHRAVCLVQAVLPRPDVFGDLVEVSPRSTVLQELLGVPLHEEEVGSAGVVVRRRWSLARSADGGRHVWAARSVHTGRGEGASGLAFDIALDVRSE